MAQTLVRGHNPISSLPVSQTYRTHIVNELSSFSMKCGRVMRISLPFDASIIASRSHADSGTESATNTGGRTLLLLDFSQYLSDLKIIQLSNVLPVKASNSFSKMTANKRHVFAFFSLTPVKFSKREK